VTKWLVAIGATAVDAALIMAVAGFVHHDASAAPALGYVACLGLRILPRLFKEKTK
jgi:hypothetical protein